MTSKRKRTRSQVGEALYLIRQHLDLVLGGRVEHCLLELFNGHLMIGDKVTGMTCYRWSIW